MVRDKIKKLKELKKVLASAKKKKEKVIFTNGCFDLLHLGHIRYLEKARSLGDKLIVAVNDDASVRRLKGDARPIIPAQQRAILIAAIECVDYVIIFAQDTPLKLIKALKPDVLVKGGDWRINDIVGKNFVKSYGGKVISVGFYKGYSTRSLIAKIKRT